MGRTGKWMRKEGTEGLCDLKGRLLSGTERMDAPVIHSQQHRGLKKVGGRQLEFSNRQLQISDRDVCSKVQFCP